MLVLPWLMKQRKKNKKFIAFDFVFKIRSSFIIYLCVKHGKGDNDLG